MNINNNVKIKWLIDGLLLTLFIVLFFMDFTGLDLHQWLGIGIGLLAGLHLLLHGTWIKEVTRRFFSHTSNQCRLYYLLDGMIFLGFGAMLTTGLIISTWLNLSLSHYDIWKALHIISSAATLLLTLFKVALHWKWIAKTTCLVQKSVSRPVLQPVGSAQTVNSSRREFMRVMGMTGFVSVLGMVGIVRSISGLKSDDEELAVTTVESGSNKTFVVAPTENNTEEPIQKGVISPTQAAIVAPTSQPAQSCQVRCRRGCSFPGKCRRYTDDNNNGRCDLGECV